MKIDLRPAGWSAALLGITGLAYAIVHEQRKANARRELKGKVALVPEAPEALVSPSHGNWLYWAPGWR